MVLKKYGILFTFSMSLLTSTALFAPPGHDEDTGKITPTTPLKKSTDQESSLPSEEAELTPEECNRRYLYTDTEEISEPTVGDIVFAKTSETLTSILEFLSDPQKIGHSVVDRVIKQSPKLIQTLADARAAVATSARSAVSTVLQRPSVVHMQNAYAMYTLEKEAGDGIAFVLPKEENDFTIVIDTNKPDASPTSSPAKKSEEESSETAWEIISSS
jgi:hypothetical protein